MPNPFRSKPPETARRGTRDRLRPRHDDSGVPPYTFAFGILLILLVGSLSFWQVTAPTPARRVIEAGIVSLTDIDRVLAEHHDELKALATASSGRAFSIPGYPIAVYVSRDELLQLPPAELRALILERSSALVYVQGLRAFDRTGGQSLSLFSAEGGLELLVGQLSADSHDKATIATGVLAALTALVAISLVFKAEGMRRVRSLGEAALPAGILGLVATVGIREIIALFGGDAPFEVEMRGIVRTTAEVPMRNFIVLAIAGAVLLVAGMALALLERVLPGPRPEPQPRYESGMEDEEYAQDA